MPVDVDYVVYCASADESSDEGYGRAYGLGLSNMIACLRRTRLRRLFFTSSTAVYAQQGGEWVDETSETAPTHFTGRRTLEAEGLVEQSGLPFTVLRCAGIYGPGRTRLIDSVRAGTARASSRFTNRIHRDDIAGTIEHLMRAGTDAPRLILSDDDPAPQADVVRFLAAHLGVQPPALADTEPGALRGGDKRCRNDRLKATGYRLLYPTYREGYAAMLSGAAPGS